MTPYNEDSFSASFESMSIGTQLSDSSNEGNIFPLYTMSYGQSSSHPSGSIGEEYGMVRPCLVGIKFYVLCIQTFRKQRKRV